MSPLSSASSSVASSKSHESIVVNSPALSLATSSLSSPHPPSPLAMAQGRHLSSLRKPVVLRIQVTMWKGLQFATHIFSENNDGISHLGITSNTEFPVLNNKIKKWLDKDDLVGHDKWKHKTFIYCKTLQQVRYYCILFYGLFIYIY